MPQTIEQKGTKVEYGKMALRCPHGNDRMCANHGLGPCYLDAIDNMPEADLLVLVEAGKLKEKSLQ